MTRQQIKLRSVVKKLEQANAKLRIAVNRAIARLEAGNDGLAEVGLRLAIPMSEADYISVRLKPKRRKKR